MTRHLMRTAIAAAAAAMLAACAAPGGQPYEQPRLELPAGSAPARVAVDWWKSYNDPQLNALVDEALANNRDLARAISRIDASRAALRSARADRFPQVNAQGSAARARASQNGPTPIPQGVSPIGNDYQVALSVSYEVDLWGRVANSTKAAREELLATEYARDTLRTALAAQVVQSYVALQSLDAQYRLFGRSVDVQRDSLKLQRLRYDSGDISELDIQQLEAELLTNEQQLPKIDRARGEAERALALVLGRSPKALVEQGVARAETPVAGAEALPEGLPSDLLMHRPDVQAAEARLRAAGARVDAARAAYFPSISLTAALGRESTELSRLTDGPSLIWNGGRIDAANDAAKAQRVQAELDYRDSVASAFTDARDALGAYSESRASLDTGLKRAKAFERAAELTRLRFNGGEASRLDVINAERLSLNAQAQNADAQRALAAAQADIYRAFGGGWADVQREASSR